MSEDAARVFLCVLDSFGIGGAPDAGQFFNDGQPDTGANTLLHIAEACAAGACDDRGRTGPLHLPQMDRLGLDTALRLASGKGYPGAHPAGGAASWAVLESHSAGKDTQTGHWELAGLRLERDWHYFPREIPAFPPETLARLRAAGGLEGTLGNCHGSGSDLLAQYGAAHLQSGWPIVYTSADSVVQIAAHEDRFGLDRLLALCEAAAAIYHPMNVGRIIARPFLGSPETGFRRTANRHDYAITPPQDTLCDRVQARGGKVIGIGKIGDIFAGKGIDRVLKGPDDMALFDHLIETTGTAAPGDLVFANFVEFDSHYGHRRDISGYAAALERFDARLPEVLSRLRPGDQLLLSADHGNDPSWVGTDHTRERVPLLAAGRPLAEAGQILPFTDCARIVAQSLF
ncbi:phosphopentomutase [Pseudooceanicola sp. CBS1P-1]|uniref:Phosphopentomutase n=1 Tax=Pseudooceanicola albus TaxID=2692189 RepID=A0A6L7G5V8_9RHOB|nr:MULTISPECIES: phosphopentomutase [Pseudooceanicola]MBT9385273.1 phosphopentomutase [Pseudooceanicola endophyticus]MXN18868.1 phosphopentomutase [Pseudooceanicola albus]